MDKTVHTVWRRGRTSRSLLSAAAVVITVSLVSQAFVPGSAAQARSRAAKRAQLRPPAIVTQIPPISAEAASLIDVDSGRVLFEREPQKRMRIASLTKIITAWIAVRSGKLDQLVTVSPNAARQEGSSVYLRAGEQQTLRALLYAMMLRSGNDAATAIAEYLGGSTAGFARIMNEEVARLGLSHSHFVNPSGLDDPGHYATAHDMAVMTSAALHVPLFRQIVATKFYTIPWPGQKWERRMRNKNKLLWMMEEADGVKTGYTKRSGRCLASSATQNGHQVALIVLRDGNDWADSVHLLRYGLTAFERRNVADWIHRSYRTKVKYGETESVTLIPQGRLYYPLHRDETAALEDRVRVRVLSAPVKVGQIGGTVEYRLHDQVIGQLPLVTAYKVAAKGWFGRLREWFSR